MEDCRKITYAGRVQRVGFRAGAWRIAQAVGVRGYAKNLRDGRVEVVVAGDTERVERFLAEMRARWGGHFEAFTVEVGPFAGGLEAFEIR
jgi:acylphosphatase